MSEMAGTPRLERPGATVTRRRSWLAAVIAIAGFGIIATVLVAALQSGGVTEARDSAPALVNVAAPALDDYGLRHPPAAATGGNESQVDDYGLRHPPAAATGGNESQLDDYGLRHPPAAATGGKEER